MGKNGGARPGAGRPRGSVAPATLRAMQVREYLTKQVAKDQGELYDALKTAAVGHLVVDLSKKEGERVYSKPPSPEAAKYLFDQVAGRPQESVKLSTPEGEPIQLNVVLETAIKRAYASGK